MPSHRKPDGIVRRAVAQGGLNPLEQFSRVSSTIGLYGLTSQGRTMKFESKLLKGKFLKRYKRFFADVELDTGETITALTPNTGSLLTCKEPGSLAYVSTTDNPNRKLKFTWEIVQSGKGLVGVNTQLANHLAQEAIENGVISELKGYETLRREVKYGTNSRIDFLLEDPKKPPCYVEVKNVSMGSDGVASFPDAVSTRATKHMGELTREVEKGNRAAVLFVVQRMDCESFTAADEIDPTYGKALREAAAAGVEILAYQADISPKEIRLTQPLPVKL